MAKCPHCGEDCPAQYLQTHIKRRHGLANDRRFFNTRPVAHFSGPIDRFGNRYEGKPWWCSICKLRLGSTQRRLHLIECHQLDPTKMSAKASRRLRTELARGASVKSRPVGQWLSIVPPEFFGIKPKMIGMGR